MREPASLWKTVSIEEDRLTMHRTRNRYIGIFVLVFFLAGSGHVFAHGDQVVVLVADGVGIIRTKLEITNPSTETRINRIKVFFHLPDGSPWTVDTNMGNSDEFLLDLGIRQTLRIETKGLSNRLISGYAVIHNFEWNAAASLDNRVTASVFYEVLDGPDVVDTVSVPNSQPTLFWMFPVEIRSTQEIYSGFAILNRAEEENRVTLQLLSSFPPFTGDATDSGSVELILEPMEQRSRFLHEAGLFPNQTSFKGILVGTAERPVEVLALLQTLTNNGVQYSTLTAQYLDAMHSESFVYLTDNLSLDADIPATHFVTLDDSSSQDLHYKFISSTVRKFVPKNGAEFALIGIRSVNEFNAITRDQLEAASYSQSTVDMSDVSGYMIPGLTLAIRTSLRRYVKMRVANVILNGAARDLAIQVYVYR